MNSLESFIASFLEYLDYELNYSKKTIATYNEALKEYSMFLNKQKHNFRYVNKDMASAYKAHLINHGYASKTSSLHLSAVRSFYEYLVEIKEIDSNPYLNIKNPKLEKKLPNFLNSSEETLMFDASQIDDDLTYRNTLIIYFLYATGLRVSELVSVKVSDLNFSDYSLKIMGKGSKERIVYFKACPQDLLNNYLKVIRPRILEGNPSDYLFISKSGKALSTRSIENIVAKYSNIKNVKSKVTPHTLRHTFATDLLNNGADIRSVGELLGHESLNTTQIYTHVTADRLKNVYNKTHPRGNLRK